MPQRVLTLVVPCLNEADGIAPFLSRCAEVERSCPAYRFDYLFVDDGSTDGTWDRITRLARENPRVRGLRLTRNYGQQRAISAGLDACDSEVVAILDADLQDPPELLKDMLDQFEAGADVVHAVRADRESDAVFKRLSAKLFYAVMRRWVLPNLPESAGDFKLISRRALEAYRAYGERVRFLRGIFATLGFQQATVEYARPPRTTGYSKYPLRRMLRLARDAVFSNTALPLRWCTYAGVCALLLWPAVFVAVALRAPSVVAFLLVAQWLFSALLLMGVGLAGEYFKIIVLEVKRRPLYLVRDSINLN